MGDQLERDHWRSQSLLREARPSLFFVLLLHCVQVPQGSPRLSCSNHSAQQLILLSTNTHTHKLPWTAGTPSNSHPHSDQYSNHRKPSKQPRTRSDSTTGTATHYLLFHSLTHSRPCVQHAWHLTHLSHKTCFLITLYLYFKTEKQRESRPNYSHSTNVSLYPHRRVKSEDYPNGTVYLTNYRILYIDAKDPARKSIGLPLRLINGIQHYVRNNSDFVNTFPSNACMPCMSWDKC